MAITDKQTAPEGDPAESTVYDGFISYSHAADDLLAPRLQAGLQRFAKPWWKRRALRIFRDESSLTANPHLWASIAEAMDDSGWFVLLLSPVAADSEWVNREVEYWVENKDPDRIIPVLTDGGFAYADGHVVSDAAPPALRGAFSDEPRWVDLRFARTEEQLDLNNASFRAAIADIASPIRGIPKDELESEEVRQHRRTIRTAWAGVVVVLLLAILASATALYAIGQRDSAQQNEQAAQQSEAAALQSEEAAQQSEQAATDFANLVLDHSAKLAGDFVHADSRNIPLPVADSPPPTPRLNGLVVTCPAHAIVDEEVLCLADSLMVHPVEPQPTFAYLAYEPFHIRHGFVNLDESPLGTEGLPPDFEVNVFITRKQGPPLAEGVFEIGTTYRYTPDYLYREGSERCGQGFLNQDGSLPCDEFVHEFNDGLPPGTYFIWIEWNARCSAWTNAEVCGSEDSILPLFAREADMDFYHDDWTPLDAFPDVPDPEFFGDSSWPWHPWPSAEDLTDQ